MKSPASSSVQRAGGNSAEVVATSGSRTAGVPAGFRSAAAVCGPARLQATSGAPPTIRRIAQDTSATSPSSSRWTLTTLLTPLRLPDVGGRYSSTMSAVDYNPRRQERRLTRWPWSRPCGASVSHSGWSGYETQLEALFQ